MRKNQNAESNIPVAEKHVGNRLWKSGKVWLSTAGLTLVTLGTVGAVLVANAQAKTEVTAPVKSSFPAPPTNTTVNWENNKPLFYVIDQNGTEHPKPELTLGDGEPAWCLGLGVPLTNNTTEVQRSASNKILNALNDEQKAVLNNTEFLGRKAGDLEGYAEAQYATYKLLDEAGVSQNQAKDAIVKDNTLLHDANKIKTGADNLIKEAKKMRELPSFNSQIIQLLQGTSKTITDFKGVIGNFPYVKVNAKGLKESIKGNDLTLKADATTPLGETKNAVQLQSTAMDSEDLPWYVFSTDGDDSGAQSQSVGATRDPSKANASLNINVISLGETTLTKSDADTGNSETQGAAQLKGAVFGLFRKSDNKQVNWSEGLKDYPLTLTAGTKADDTKVSIKMGDDLKAGVKNLNKSNSYYWMETEAPEGYSLSTKKIDVTFDSSSQFDDKTSNYIDDEKATDKVNVFNFMFTKVQDVTGSYTGLNGAEFQLIPQEGTKGKTITATSGTGTDSNGYTVNGLTKFDGEANQKAGNPSKDGIAEGHYHLHESKTPKGLKPIDDVDVSVTPIKDKDGKITTYEEKFTDLVTNQVIDDVKTPVDQMKDNDILVNVNLGQFTDKPETPVVPTIKTKAHVKDGSQTIKAKDISDKTPMYDDVILTNAQQGEVQHGYLHRIVKDEQGKVVSDKIVAENKFVIDDATAKKQEDEILATVDTSQDAKEPSGYSVTYVWAEKLNDSSDKNEQAKHDDLNDKDETIVSPTGHTQVSTKMIDAKTNQKFNDKYHATGLTEGESYTIKVNGAWSKKLNKVVPASGKLTFKATAETMDVDVPITIDAHDLSNDDLTMLEELDDFNGEMIVQNNNHNDTNETVHVKPTPPVKPVTPTTPSTTPAIPKASLPTTGSSTGDALMYGGMAVLLVALGGTVYYMKKKNSVEK
ncbi:SpaA isopeptide-forming pilin-related protein [Lactococcus lactis]|uniref:SpaA isopeptide-forming pilin-related protein n=1 Tax=Lactococcus lactis TaxID=1358 RepID=A0A9X4NHP2_9LACT|nr:SpaA isopeptide-forming pilin-related protein [Lactococcus lactis]MDG4983927.1 SpaA isopeptide-forming pilin-related protein [Lactococcus lactis]